MVARRQGCLASSMISDLKVFSHNPVDGSFTTFTRITLKILLAGNTYCHINGLDWTGLLDSLYDKSLALY